MAKSSGSDDPSLKKPEAYEALRDKGYSKEASARISNAQANPSMQPSRKGGESSAYEEWTKDELEVRARELDVEGRSTMTKDELIAALRDR